MNIKTFLWLGLSILAGAARLFLPPPVMAQTAPGLELEFAPNPVITGEELILTARIDNQSANGLTDADLTIDYSPALSAYPEISAGNEFDCSTRHLTYTNRISCRGGVIEAGEEAELEFGFTAPYTPYSYGVGLSASGILNPGSVRARAGTRLVPVADKPDLMVSGTVSPETVLPGEPVKISLTVTNIGPQESGAANFRLVLPDGSVKERLLPALFSRQSWSVNEDYSAVQAGSQTVTAAVDPDNLIDEVYETNNVKTINFQAAAGLADLSVQAITGPGKIAGTSDFIRTVTIVNDGDAAAAGFTIKDIFSKVPLKSVTADHGLNCRRILSGLPFTRTGYQCSGGRLNPGETAVISVTYPGTISGRTVSGTVTVDVWRQITESNETNNSRSYSFRAVN